MNVPRARLVEAAGSEREWQSQLVGRYRRSSPEVEQSVLGVYLSGKIRAVILDGTVIGVNAHN